MKFQEVQNGYILRLEKGEELIQTLKDFARSENLPSVAVQAIGSVANPVLGYYDLATKKFIEKRLSEEYELLSTTGSVGFDHKEILVHIHASLADKEFSAFGGHAIELTTNATLEVFLFNLDQRLNKSYNNAIGLKLYDLQCDFNS